MTLTQSLEAAIAKRAEEYAWKDFDKHHGSFINPAWQRENEAYTAGASSLLPLVVKCVEALEHYESAHYDHRGYACFGDDTASEALAELRAFAEGKP